MSGGKNTSKGALGVQA